MKTFLQKTRARWQSESGGGGSYALLWLLGVPIPVLAIIFLFKGCS
ncbi:MAG: hypothetical protein ABIT76_06215 [Chthoniobacterales bacterium]